MTTADVIAGHDAHGLRQFANPDLIFPTLVANLLSPGLVGLVMAALIAAVMSHISGVLNSCMTVVTIDFYLPLIRKDASDEQAVRFGRMAGVVIILVGILLARILLSHSDRPIFIFLLDAYGYFTPGIAAMFLMGIFWKGTTHAGTLTAGFLTTPLSVAIQYFWPQMPFFNRTGITFWICMASCLLVSLLTTPKSAGDASWNLVPLISTNPVMVRNCFVSIAGFFYGWILLRQFAQAPRDNLPGIGRV